MTLNVKATGRSLYVQLTENPNVKVTPRQNKAFGIAERAADSVAGGFAQDIVWYNAFGEAFRNAL
jgi:hypothetical protein